MATRRRHSKHAPVTCAERANSRQIPETTRLWQSAVNASRSFQSRKRRERTAAVFAHGTRDAQIGHGSSPRVSPDSLKRGRDGEPAGCKFAGVLCASQITLRCDTAARGTPLASTPPRDVGGVPLSPIEHLSGFGGSSGNRSSRSARAQLSPGCSLGASPGSTVREAEGAGASSSISSPLRYSISERRGPNSVSGSGNTMASRSTSSM